MATHYVELINRARQDAHHVIDSTTPGTREGCSAAELVTAQIGVDAEWLDNVGATYAEYREAVARELAKLL